MEIVNKSKLDKQLPCKLVCETTDMLTGGLLLYQQANGYFISSSWNHLCFRVKRVLATDTPQYNKILRTSMRARLEKHSR